MRNCIDQTVYIPKFPRPYHIGWGEGERNKLIKQGREFLKSEAKKCERREEGERNGLSKKTRKIQFKFFPPKKATKKVKFCLNFLPQ